MAATKSKAAQLIATLYEDPEECARIAKLRYVSPDEPGMKRLRSGKGFTYRDVEGRTVVDVKVRNRIRKLAIPPAWQNVWICTLEDGHILAVGEDERERRQYIYHERWRSLRDQLNFYRLIGFGDALPTIREDVATQLRRRTLDADRVLAAMIRIIDIAGLRVGNEVYADENDSYGLSTLSRRHVQVHGARMDFRFPAKSGKTAEVSVMDAGAARVIATLAERRSRWLFNVDGARIDADEINAHLAKLSGAHLTAKDFRTWNGTKTAFRYLRNHLPADGSDTHILAALDEASDALGNTRSVARAHYVHPEVIDGYTSGELERFVTGKRTRPAKWLEIDERLLLAYLAESLEARAGEFAELAS
ncbi:DNA topoisomerase IB [uncultured Jatrophihabitans sp.]|uniref:DNA topoisomerase IB n=1 Tax=uncultured Jatrophihabitans sp. TaxID=1610747 RepID=UPI0035CB2A14